jgi:hypothetical protein
MDSSKKKEWLDVLFYDIGKQQYDFRVASLKRVGEDVYSSKWRPFSQVVFPVGMDDCWKLDSINNREILPNELVIDLEEKKDLKKILEKINKEGFKPFIYDTHSRGVHIHAFFTRALSQKEKIRFTKLFCGDMQKAFQGSSIALEYAEHWKSGMIKSRMEL